MRCDHPSSGTLVPPRAAQPRSAAGKFRISLPHPQIPAPHYAGRSPTGVPVITGTGSTPV
jgi:hypothetical protein